MILFLLNNALSAAFGEAVTPTIQDPYIIWVWAGSVIDSAVLTLHFYFTDRHMDNDEFMSEHNIIDGGDVQRLVTDIELRALDRAS